MDKEEQLPDFEFDVLEAYDGEDFESVSMGEQRFTDGSFNLETTGLNSCIGAAGYSNESEEGFVAHFEPAGTDLSDGSHEGAEELVEELRDREVEGLEVKIVLGPNPYPECLEGTLNALKSYHGVDDIDIVYEGPEEELKGRYIADPGFSGSVGLNPSEGVFYTVE